MNVAPVQPKTDSPQKGILPQRVQGAFLTGLFLVVPVSVLEIAHTLHESRATFGGTLDRCLLALAMAGPSITAALASGSLLAALVVITTLAGRAAGGGIRRRAAAESAWLALVVLAGGTFAHSRFALEIVRIANATVRMLNPRVSWIEGIWFEKPFTSMIVLGVLAIPAATLALAWSVAASARMKEPPGGPLPAFWRRGGIPRIALALAAAGTGVFIFRTTETAYVNQYREMHLVGLLAAALAIAFAFRVLPRAVRWAVTRCLLGRKSVVILPVLTLALLGATHVILTERHAVEATLMWRTNLSRKIVFLLRDLTDWDHDGASSLFGGDDPDDGAREIKPWWMSSKSQAPTSAGPDQPFLNPLPTVDRAGFTFTDTADHVVMISIDALRADVAGFAGAVHSKTPRLDALAKDGAAFLRAYAPGSYTHVTLPSILTGRHPIPGPGWKGARGFPSIAARSGVRTTGVFCDFFQAADEFQHHDAAIAHDQREPSKESVAKVLADLNEPRKRTLLWVHLIDPHNPYVDRSPQGGLLGDIARYETEVTAADAAAADIIAAARETLGPKTVFILFADHGEEFREHGSCFHGITVYEELIHVPLLVLGGSFPARTIGTTVSLAHLGATVLDLLHLPRPDSFRVGSLARLARDGADPSIDPTILSVNNSDMCAFIEPGGRWKLVYDTRCAFVELFDLEHDPSERTNLADREPGILADLKNAAVAWRALDSFR